MNTDTTTDTIVQFVCFTSPLETDAFIEMWESFAGQPMTSKKNTLLKAALPERNGNRFTYLSQHSSGGGDFDFDFMKGSSRKLFPENKTSVKQAGGYFPLQFQPGQRKKGEARIIAFAEHGENELGFYRYQSFHRLNIYEAYFENCTYTYIIEFFLPVKEAPALLALIKEKAGVEAALYEECSF